MGDGGLLLVLGGMGSCVLRGRFSDLHLLMATMTRWAEIEKCSNRSKLARSVMLGSRLPIHSGSVRDHKNDKNLK